MADTKIPRKGRALPPVRETASPDWADKQEEIDQVDEAAEQSFPASDPPSWTPLTAGPPAHAPAEDSLAAGQLAGAADLDQPLTGPDVLPDLLHQLETALIAVTPCEEQAWQARVVDELRAVRTTLGPHGGAIEPLDSGSATIDQDRPTLARQESHLREEHADIQSQARMLLILLEKEAKDRTLAFSHIHRRVDLLLEALRRHQVQETGLIMESLCTDIGTGD